MSNIKKAVNYANFHYYSHPMRVVNLNKLQIPFSLLPLTKIRFKREGWAIQDKAENYEFDIRLSHGLPHALAAMEAIPAIDKAYSTHVFSYDSAIADFCKAFEITKEQFLEMVEIATLFHDTGRLGDGVDLWDKQSGDNCEHYFNSVYWADFQVKPSSERIKKLARIFGDAVRYKDNQARFMGEYGLAYDYIRQLINMADSLEVMRTRDKFHPARLPIARRVEPQVMVEHIIPELVIPHRQKIIDEGRLSLKGQVEYKVSDEGMTESYDDSNYKAKPGYDMQKLAASYIEKMKKYDAAVLHINQQNIDDVYQRVLQGIKAYIIDYKSHSGLQLVHNGFFSIRYHGKLGQQRAQFYQQIFESEKVSEKDKATALHALLTSKAGGQSLRDYVYRSFNQANRDVVIEQLANHVRSYGQWDAATYTRIADFANGITTNNPLERLEGRKQAQPSPL
ncbi:hypothetical protein Lbir_0451 [Legionella birminghamensis]|uniref:Uncharacterized protein n=1 Tax=Legionella birminghamensis TaxID=28083 RepID=A0A378IDI4_9GAMM|nr:hypothetical protein [Legionella birminghamensis]KTC75306.1 hypothetical protein Lbir_0451 [Legionella birminghamensis]STX33073.1 Uncharacterised protein [Legionella birminghamensis]